MTASNPMQAPSAVSLVERVARALVNEVETVRCHLQNFRLDPPLIRELLALREIVEKLPPQALSKPPAQSKPKSALVRFMEAQAVFGEYCEREDRRLGRKLEALAGGMITPEYLASDDAERSRNESIAQRAIAIEAGTSGDTAALSTALQQDEVS